MIRNGYSILFFSEKHANENLSDSLNNNGFKIHLVEDTKKTNEIISDNKIQIVILDIETEEYAKGILNYLETIKELSFVPKVIVSTIADSKTEIELLKLGIWDYIIYPCEDEKLLARINCNLLNSLYINKVVKENLKLKSVGIVDPLTGLYTRKYLMNRLVEEISRAVRKGENLSFSIIQMGNYDELLNNHGQGAIEHILNQACIIIKQLVRLSDVVIRYGEKELAVLCPITDRGGMDVFVDRLNNKVNNSVFEYSGEILKFSVNIGVYTLESSDFNSFENKITNMILYTEEALERAVNDEYSNVEYY